jgi:hypothetical protein
LQDTPAVAEIEQSTEQQPQEDTTKPPEGDKTAEEPEQEEDE